MQNLSCLTALTLKGFKETIFKAFVFLFSLLLLSCSPSQKEKEINIKPDSAKTSIVKDSVVSSNKLFVADCKILLAAAKKMDSTLLKEVEVKTEVATKAIKAFTDFAYYCSSDSICPIYLIKTAQVAQSINNIPQAKVVLEKCIEDYPKSTHRPAALFLLAQLYDEATQLNKEDEAKKIYMQIIKEYPKSDWANSAKGALSFLGKTDAQIMEELKKKK